jgi:phasin family protein
MQLDVANKLSMKNLEGFSDLMNLNAHVLHNSLNDSMEKMHALLSSKNSLEFFSLVATQAQPNAGKLISYGNDLVGITTSMRDEFFKATQIEVAETSKEMTSILEHMVEHETDSFNNMIRLTKATVKEAEAEQAQVVHATEETIKRPRATPHKSAEQHHVTQRKKHASAGSKKTNGHRKATH